MAKTKAPKKPSKPPAETTDCDYCLYLKRYYPDIPLASLKLHCAKHTLDKLPETDGLPPVKTDKVVQEAKEVAPTKLVASWDGRIRTCWAAAGSVPPPESVAWEHLKEWADARRADNPQLTVRALLVLYRSCRPQEAEEGVCRIKKLFPEESRAEAMIWKQEFTDKPEQTITSHSSSPNTNYSKPSDKPREKSSEDGPTSSSRPDSTKPTNRPSSKELDEWGYKTGTRAATINAFLSDKWMTSKEIEQKSGATSAGSHLSALVAAGHAEYQKPAPGEKGGKFRRKP